MQYPWRGILVATALPLRTDLSVDFDRFEAHVRRLIGAGCQGVCPNGSLGEYQTLTDDERAHIVRTAVAAAGDAAVVPGVSAYGAIEAARWAERAAEAGAAAVLCLPPNAYRADERTVTAHFAAVAGVGLPVMAYNNPYDTRVDLTPELLARLHGEGLIVAVKEFSGDVRRAYEIRERAPGLDLIIGADDVLLELALAGAVGWVAGVPNALPRACVELYEAAIGGDLERARTLYRILHPLLRWDSRVEFVQAIKLAMDLTGGYGGPCRPPRLPLTQAQEDAVREAVTYALDRLGGSTRPPEPGTSEPVRSKPGTSDSGSRGPGGPEPGRSEPGPSEVGASTGAGWPASSTPTAPAGSSASADPPVSASAPAMPTPSDASHSPAAPSRPTPSTPPTPPGAPA
jgi:dihydrodipicolinate synthase/N-acetylneuraminate lyase